MLVIYPNPAKGESVQLLAPAYEGISDVRVEIYTSAFRKVQNEIYPSVHSGTPVTIILKDRWGTPLANGLYYVVVTVNGNTSLGKLLILR